MELLQLAYLISSFATIPVVKRFSRLLIKKTCISQTSLFFIFTYKFALDVKNYGLKLRHNCYTDKKELTFFL